MGTIQTRISDANHAVLQAQNDRWSLGPIETITSGHNVAVVSVHTTEEGWDPEGLAILLLITLFWMHKMTGKVWDP